MVSGGSQHQVYGRTHYERNKDHYLQRAAERKKENRRFIQELKAERGCADCGVKDYRVLEFDHIPGRGKTMNLSKMADLGHSRERMLQEIERCEVVCANCHRIRTFDRFDSKVDVAGSIPARSSRRGCCGVQGDPGTGSV